jgi:hypothetical protein
MGADRAGRQSARGACGPAPPPRLSAVLQDSAISCATLEVKELVWLGWLLVSSPVISWPYCP